MARQLSGDSFDVDKEVHAWLSAWWQERARYLSRVDVRVVEPLREDQEISVVVFPHIHHRHALGCNQEPQYRGGYELPIYLLRETLTAETANRLQASLSRIKNAQGLDRQQAVAFLIQLYLIVVDLGRATYEGNPSILLGPTWGQLTNRTVPIEEWLVQPVWRLESVLDFWTQFGECFVHGFSKSSDGSLGKADYLTIPPRWVTQNDLDQQVDELDGLKIPVLVSPNLKRLVESLQDACAEFNRIAGPVTMTLSIPCGQNFPERTDEPGGQEGRAARPRFAHSPDFRMVSLRGQPFSLTSRQAQVVQILFEAHVNGHPEVGLHYILEQLGSPSRRLRDTFKNSPAWRALIVPGETRGTYRLNM